MARNPSPEYSEALRLFLDSDGSLPLVEIARKVGKSDGQIRKWKSEKKWDDLLEAERSKNGNVTESNRNVTEPANSNVTVSKEMGMKEGKQGRRGAPDGNVNGLGNAGNPNPMPNYGNSGGGAPPGNQNAVTTWEHAQLWDNSLTEDEREFLDKYIAVEDPVISEMNREIGLMKVRLGRMLGTQVALLNDDSLITQVRVLQELMERKEVVERDGKRIPVPVKELVVTQVEDIKAPRIDKTIAQNEAITRLQDKILKAIAAREKMVRERELLGIAKERLVIEKITKGIKTDTDDADQAHSFDLSTLSDEELMQLEQLAGKATSSRSH